MPTKRVVFVVNHVAFFVSHRLPLALGAKQAGYDVHLLTGQAASDEMEELAVEQLRACGVSHKRTVFRSAGMNPLVEFLGLLQLMWFVYRYKPNLVHCVSPKGVLYGGIVARICRVQGLVLAISGMGYAYTDGEVKGRSRILLRWIYGTLAGFAFRRTNTTVIVQNKDDFQSVMNSKLASQSSVVLIPGSGVDLSLFVGCSPEKKARIVLFPARILKDKGAEEFVEAARRIKKIAPDWRFVLAGAAGYDNPSAISKAQLMAWVAEGSVEWLGHVNDMVPLFRDSAIVCLPSYREGMPKALLEAAAAGCAVVTTNSTGCRESVEPGVTGDLVPVGDFDALTDVVLSLILDESRCRAYGHNAMKRAQASFSVNSVVSQTLDIYKSLLGNE